MTTLKVGIASYEEMKARTMAVARGERRLSPDEPKVWFTSTESFAKVLSARSSMQRDASSPATSLPTYQTPTNLPAGNTNDYPTMPVQAGPAGGSGAGGAAPVSGATGGGTVLIGGDVQGTGNVPTSEVAYVGAKAKISASTCSGTLSVA